MLGKLLPIISIISVGSQNPNLSQSKRRVLRRFYRLIRTFFYYLSNSSRDWMAPKGITCLRVLPKNTDIYITNTTKKT